jgi:hypothetical protein
MAFKMRMNLDLELCGDFASEFYDFLSKKGILPNGLALGKHEQSFMVPGFPHHSFRITGFKENPGFNQVSVNIPPDVNYSDIKDGKLPSVIEFGLYQDDKMVYIEHLNYGDVCSFDSFKEALEEIKRLSVLVVDISESDNE